MRLPRLGIRSLINFGFGSLLALGLLLTIIAVGTLTLINREVGKMDALSEDGARVQDISRDFEILRITIQRNKLNDDGSASRRAAQHAMDLLQVSASAPQPEQRRKMFADLKAAVGRFLDRRAELVKHDNLAQSDKAALFTDGDELAAEGDKLLEAARANNDPAITELVAQLRARVLLVRVANWRYLAVQDADGQTTFAGRLADARQSMAALEQMPLSADLRALVDSVRKNLDHYAEIFQLAAIDTLTSSQMHDEAAKELSAMQSALAEAEASLRADFGSARNSVDSTIAVISLSTSLMRAARSLAAESNRLSAKVETFLATVRAA